MTRPETIIIGPIIDCWWGLCDGKERFLYLINDFDSMYRVKFPLDQDQD